MTTEAYSVPPVYTIAGIGPYAIPHEYQDEREFAASVVAGAAYIDLTNDDFNVTPAGPASAGNLFLTAPAALLHAGSWLVIRRRTNVEQGWQGMFGAREKGLEVQLDRLTQALQEQADLAKSSIVRARGETWTVELPPLQSGRSLIARQDGDGFEYGPNAAEIAGAADQAALARGAADEAQDVFNNLLDTYMGGRPVDPVANASGGALVPGNLYFNTNVSEMRVWSGPVLGWIVVQSDAATFMQRGQNLADLVNAATARTNLGLGTAATTAAAAYATALQGAKADTALQSVPGLTPAQAVDPNSTVNRGVSGQTLAQAIAAYTAPFTTTDIIPAQEYRGTFAHGLGVRPTRMLLTARCIVPHAGYAIDDKVHFSPGIYDGATAQGLNLAEDATDITVGIYRLYVRHKTTGIGGGAWVEITAVPASWRLNVLAWR